ncbi:MAG: insulinase family protein [Treponema sp.]|jgi:zinc protease|nr:insulinase family protein [Treponema sp.]
MKLKRFAAFKIIFILLTTLVITCTTTPKIDFGGLGAAQDKIPLNSSVLTGFLPNGLRYIILENSMPENRAHLALVVNAGSVAERDDQRGFAHFVEHMAFKGTARFPEMELIDYLRSLGMRFGPDANAYTSYNETVYHFDVPVEITDGIKRIPSRALAILDDWTFQVSFNPEDVKSESRVVLEEMRARSGAMDRVRKTTLPVLFAGSAYEQRDIIGLAETIENSTSDQLREFYDRWYRSDNMALVFVGDFDGRVLEAELYRHFNMPASAEPVNRPSFNLPPPVSGNFHVEIITDPELTSSSFMIYYKQKQGAPRGTLTNYRQSIIDHLIYIMLMKRFDEAASDPLSASNDSWGYIWRWASNSRFYTMGTQPKTGYAQQALRELLLEKESIRRFGFTESELERAKLSLISYMENMLSEKDRMESRTFIRGFTNHFLYGEDMADIEWEMNAVNSLLPGITSREITYSVRNYFAANDITVFLLSPLAEAESLPSKERIRSIFTETLNARLTKRQDITLSGDLLDRVPAAAEVISQELDTDTGAYILTMENGATIILKETTNRNNEIILYAVANGGTANATEETIVSVNLLSEMINVSGLGPYSRTDLTNKLAGKQVSFSFWTSNFSRGFQGSSTTADLITLFEMIHLFFTNPRLDERSIAAMIDQYRTNLLHQEENPQRFFSRELTRLVNNNHPLFKPLELDDMDRVSITQAFSFLNRCLNPGDYTFIFTGNLNLQLIRELSAVYIASIPQRTSMNSWTDPEINRPLGGRRTINKGVDERCIVYLRWAVQGSSLFDEQKNQVTAVLSEYIDILLTDEIREKMSGVYSISSGASVSVIPTGEYRINVYFICNPDRAEELIAAVKNSLTSLYTLPLNIETFNKAKEALFMGHERSMQQNLHIAQSYANSSVLFNTPLNRLNQRPDAIRAVTVQDVQALSRQILVNAPLELILFPE